MEQTLHIVGRIAGSYLGLPEGVANPDLDLVAAGLDSLRMVELLVLVEQHFRIQIPESMLDASAFQSVRRIAAMVDAVGQASGAVGIPKTSGAAG
jgi:acyl carrier protein